MYIHAYRIYYFDSELCWYNYYYCAMLNKIIMTIECLVSNLLRKQMFHQDYNDLRSLIIIYKINKINLSNNIYICSPVPSNDIQTSFPVLIMVLVAETFTYYYMENL